MLEHIQSQKGDSTFSPEAVASRWTFKTIGIKSILQNTPTGTEWQIERTVMQHESCWRASQELLVAVKIWVRLSYGCRQYIAHAARGRYRLPAKLQIRNIETVAGVLEGRQCRSIQNFAELQPSHAKTVHVSLLCSLGFSKERRQNTAHDCRSQCLCFWTSCIAGR